MGYELSRNEDGSIRLLREDMVELYECLPAGPGGEPNA
jgi:hypothetical protein